MTRFLLATDSVHTTAAACDYLADRLGADDVVTVLTIRETGADPRDGGDAQNVARVRLGALAPVEAETREGEPVAAVLDFLAREHVDELVVGTHRGIPDAEPKLGSTARKLLVDAPVPVVVVPINLPD